MVRARSLPMLATALAVLGFVAWMNLGASRDTSLFAQPAAQASAAHSG